MNITQNVPLSFAEMRIASGVPRRRWFADGPAFYQPFGDDDARMGAWFDNERGALRLLNGHWAINTLKLYLKGVALEKLSDVLYIVTDSGLRRSNHVEALHARGIAATPYPWTGNGELLIDRYDSAGVLPSFAVRRENEFAVLQALKPWHLEPRVRDELNDSVVYSVDAPYASLEHAVHAEGIAVEDASPTPTLDNEDFLAKVYERRSAGLPLREIPLTDAEAVLVHASVAGTLLHPEMYDYTYGEAYALVSEYLAVEDPGCYDAHVAEGLMSKLLCYGPEEQSALMDRFGSRARIYPTPGPDSLMRQFIG